VPAANAPTPQQCTAKHSDSFNGAALVKWGSQGDPESYRHLTQAYSREAS
jgi:hypothetical protein